MESRCLWWYHDNDNVVEFVRLSLHWARTTNAVQFRKTREGLLGAHVLYSRRNVQTWTSAVGVVWWETLQSLRVRGVLRAADDGNDLHPRRACKRTARLFDKGNRSNSHIIIIIICVHIFRARYAYCCRATTSRKTDLLFSFSVSVFNSSLAVVSYRYNL